MANFKTQALYLPQLIYRSRVLLWCTIIYDKTSSFGFMPEKEHPLWASFWCRRKQYWLQRVWMITPKLCFSGYRPPSRRSPVICSDGIHSSWVITLLPAAIFFHIRDVLLLWRWHLLPHWSNSLFILSKVFFEVIKLQCLCFPLICRITWSAGGMSKPLSQGPPDDGYQFGGRRL